MLTVLEIIIANISEIIFSGLGEAIIDKMIESFLLVLKISWHILSRREAHYVIYTYTYIEFLVVIRLAPFRSWLVSLGQG